MYKSLTITSIIFLCSLNIGLRAADTLKYISKYMLDLSYAHQSMMTGNFNYDVLYSSYSFISLSENYKLHVKGYYGLNFNYLISKEFKKANQFYIGIGVNYTQYQIDHLLYDHTLSPAHVGSTSVSYSQHEFKYNVNNLSIMPNLSYQVIFKHIIFSNRVGFNYSKNLSKLSAANSYTANEYEHGVYTDPAYITATNPTGQYYGSKLTSSSTLQDKIDDSSFNLFYNMGFGVRFKKLMPFINIEVTRISQKFKNPYAKLQVGISYLF